MDCVYSNTAVSARQSEQLIQKLQNFLPEYKRRRYQHLTIVGTKRKTPNKEVFLNIELLDEAITKKKKVEFEYTNYNLKKELVARRTKPYKVSHMRWLRRMTAIIFSAAASGMIIFQYTGLIKSGKSVSLTRRQNQSRPA